MATHSEIATDQEQSERAPRSAPVVGSTRACAVCGTMLTGRPQQKCCSARCRAAKSRWGRAKAQVERDERVRELLRATLRVLGEPT